jgi:hypothetical protein
MLCSTSGRACSEDWATISSTRRRISASTSRKTSSYSGNAARSCYYVVRIASGRFSMAKCIPLLLCVTSRGPGPTLHATPQF